MNPNDIRSMTGADAYNKPQLDKHDTIRLNGDTGKFVITHLTAPKEQNGKYKRTEVDGPISVVFLKVRRRLIEASRDGVVAQTNEHNTPNDAVTLWRDGRQPERGVARDIRDRYENLRTEQIVYVRYKGEIYKLSVKGASLSGTDDTTSFYKYLSSFSDGETPWYEIMTKLTPVLAGEGSRKYFLIDFQKGEQLDDERKAVVYDNIRSVHNNCAAVDAHYQTATIAKEQIETINDTETRNIPETDVEYPEEEINPDDIPF